MKELAISLIVITWPYYPIAEKLKQDKHQRNDDKTSRPQQNKKCSSNFDTTVRTDENEKALLFNAEIITNKQSLSTRSYESDWRRQAD